MEITLPPIITALINGISQLPGVHGCVLGGSRATQTHGPTSDYDIGLYYNEEFSIASCSDLASEILGYQTVWTNFYEWGPWVNGGAWLRYEDIAIDVLYRNFAQVTTSYHNALHGKVIFHYQLGHPFGVADHCYIGELAESIPLMMDGALSQLHCDSLVYPKKLTESLVFHGLFDASFYLELAKKAIVIHDIAYISHCFHAAIQLMLHALFAANNRWLLNEKRALSRGAKLPITVPALAERFMMILPYYDDTNENLESKLNNFHALLSEVKNLLGYCLISSGGKDNS